MSICNLVGGGQPMEYRDKDYERMTQETRRKDGESDHGVHKDIISITLVIKNEEDKQRLEKGREKFIPSIAGS